MGKMGKKRKTDDDEYDVNPTAKQKVAPHVKNQEKRLIVILEAAQLESVKVWAPGHLRKFVRNFHENADYVIRLDNISSLIV